jgi:hypothetical protein
MPHGTKLLIRDVRCHAASGGNPDMARILRCIRLYWEKVIPLAREMLAADGNRGR